MMGWITIRHPGTLQQGFGPCASRAVKWPVGTTLFFRSYHLAFLPEDREKNKVGMPALRHQAAQTPLEKSFLYRAKEGDGGTEGRGKTEGRED